MTDREIYRIGRILLGLKQEALKDATRAQAARRPRAPRGSFDRTAYQREYMRALRSRRKRQSDPDADLSATDGSLLR